MGYYVEVPSSSGKAKQIADIYGGIIVTEKEAREAMTDSSVAVIIVMDNGMFEAAGFAYDMNEFKAFTGPNDYRPKQFVLMDRAKAKELTKCNR